MSQQAEQRARSNFISRAEMGRRMNAERPLGVQQVINKRAAVRSLVCACSLEHVLPCRCMMLACLQLRIRRICLVVLLLLPIRDQWQDLTRLKWKSIRVHQGDLYKRVTLGPHCCLL